MSAEYLPICEHAERISAIMLDSLVFCSDALGFESLVGALLSERASRIKKQASGQDHQNFWLMLPVLTCEAVACEALTTRTRRIEAAYHVAAAWELGNLAATYLDTWQDQDSRDTLLRSVGPERTVNLAIGLVALSLLGLSRFVESEGLPTRTIVALQHQFHRTLLRMVEGQDADLRDALDLKDYLTVARAKTGSLFRLACWSGAVTAGAPDDVAEQYGAFGEALGLLIQAWNDLYGLEAGAGERDEDHRRTLPILAALALADDRQMSGEMLVQSTAGQGGKVYALMQIAILHQQATAALARCPAAGRLSLYLDAYAIDQRLNDHETELPR